MKSLLRALFAATALLTFACSAQESAIKEGTHYKKVREVQKPADPKRISVEEFFWYGCGHCFQFESSIAGWKKNKPADVDFVPVPNSLGRPVGILHSKAYYTAESLNLLDKMHLAIFRGIHEKRFPLDTEIQLQALFEAETGILPDVFTSTFSGFAVDSRVRRAESLSRSYGISSTPTLVVGGTYYTNSSLAGGFTQMLKTMDLLIEKVRKERAGK